MVQDKEVRNMLMQEKYDRMDWYSYGDEKKAEGWAEGRAEERMVEEEKNRRRVWRMHDDGMSVSKIAENMEISLDTVQKWINGPKPAYV